MERASRNEPPRGNAFMHVKCGAHPIPSLPICWVAGGRLEIPTKTPFVFSQFGGRLLSSLRVPLQVFRTSFSGSAFLWYLLLLDKIRSCSSRLFRVVIREFLTMEGFSTEDCEGSTLKSLLHLSFHSRNAHSEAVMRSRWDAPALDLPSSDFMLVVGRAMIVVMLKFSGQLIFFILQRDLTTVQAWLQRLSLQSKSMCCIDLTVWQF